MKIVVGGLPLSSEGFKCLLWQENMKKITLLLTFVLMLTLVSGAVATSNPGTLQDLEREIARNMTLRETEFTITYTGDTNELVANLSKVIENAYNSDYYLRWNWKNYRLSASGVAGAVNLNFVFSYHTTKEQEAYVTQEVEKIIDKVTTDDMDIYQKIFALNEYVKNRVSYDNTLSKFSAYDALKGSAVCQGYTLLMNRLLQAIGIENRVATGVLQGDSHSWNMVKIDGVWYHLDVTNNGDDNRYFLVGNQALISDGFKIDAGFVASNDNYVYVEKEKTVDSDKEDITPPANEKEEVVVPDDEKDEEPEVKTLTQEEIDRRLALVQRAETTISRFEQYSHITNLRTALNAIENVVDEHDKNALYKRVHKALDRVYADVTRVIDRDRLELFKAMIEILPDSQRKADFKEQILQYEIEIELQRVEFFLNQFFRLRSPSSLRSAQLVIERMSFVEYQDHYYNILYADIENEIRVAQAQRSRIPIMRIREYLPAIIDLQMRDYFMELAK